MKNLVQEINEKLTTLSCGFAVITTTEADDVEDDAVRDKLLTKEDIKKKSPAWRKFWDEYSENNLKVERNVEKWLKKTLESARNEGHGSDNELVGSCTFNPYKKKQLEFVMSHSRQAEVADPDYETAFYKDVKSDLPMDIKIEFFDISDDAYEAWEDDEDDVDALVGMWESLSEKTTPKKGREIKVEVYLNNQKTRTSKSIYVPEKWFPIMTLAGQQRLDKYVQEYFESEGYSVDPHIRYMSSL